MLRFSYLPLLIFALCDIRVYAGRNSLAAHTELQQRRHGSTPEIVNRRGQSICSAPSGGCGYGLWNEDSCECNCVPPYCFNEIYQSCISPGACPNAFEGCTPHVDCPYFANPMTGKCESGSTVAAGVYTIFRTSQECCTTNYPSDASVCLATPPPTASPTTASPTTASPTTASPSVATAVVAESQITKPPTAGIEIEAVAENEVEEIVETETVSPPLTTVGIYLSPIPIKIHNLQPNFELNDDRKGDMEEIFHDKLITTNDEMNVTILSLELVENIFTGRYLSEILTLDLHTEVTGASIIPGSIHDAYQKALQDQMYDIGSSLKELWGPEVYSDSVILGIGDAQTTPAPSPQTPSLPELTFDPTSPNDDGGAKSVPIWAVVVFTILFAMLCGGLLFWQRRREKDLDRQAPTAPTHNISYFDEEMSHSPPSVISKMTHDTSHKMDSDHYQSHRSRMSSNQSRQKKADRGFNTSHNSRMSSNQSRTIPTDVVGFNTSRNSHMSCDQSRQSRSSSKQSRQSSRMDRVVNQGRQREANEAYEMSNTSLSIYQQQRMEPSSRDLNFNQSGKPGMDPSSRDLHFNQSGQPGMDPSSRDLNFNQSGKPGMDPSSRDLNFDQLHHSQLSSQDQPVVQSHDYRQDQSPDRVQVDQHAFRDYEIQSIAEEEVLKESVKYEKEESMQFENMKESVRDVKLAGSMQDDGYDGGKSSFFISNNHISVASVESDSDDDEDSTEENNVLGLLYYDGASSAGESVGRESGKSRRSRRTRGSSGKESSRYSSGKSTKYDSGKSSKNSSGKSSKYNSGKSGKSSKSKSSRSGKPRRKKTRSPKKEESNEHIPSGGTYSTNPSHEHIPTGGTYATKPPHDHINDPMIYSSPSAQLGTLDENKSIFSHGSTIRTEDNHRRSYATEDYDAGTDEYGLSFNSAGEDTSGYRDEPEVKL